MSALALVAMLQAMAKVTVLFLLFTLPLIGAKKPNFIFVLGDDINRDNLGCYSGGVTCRTPHLDRLAADGVRFGKAYTSVAMCAPFRQELFSGRTPWRTRTFLNHSRSTAETKSLPHYLKTLGYRVALLGKTHIGPKSCYPFENLGDTNNNEVFLKKAKAFIESCQKESVPFCLIIASHDAHAPFTNGDASEYSPDKLDIPPYWIDTPELRKALPPYLAEVTNFDALVGEVRGFLDQSGLASKSVLFACTEQGSQFPFAKWTCFDNGLHTGLIVYGPGRLAKGYVSQELFWMCDVAPTMVELAGGEVKPKAFDGRSQVANLRGEKTRVHDYVFGAFSNKGIIDNMERIFPIRCVRDERYSLIYSPSTEGITSNVTLTGALAKVHQEEPARKQKAVHPAESWVKAKGSEDPIVRKLFHRPEFALYDLENDPYELANLAEDPEHATQLARLKKALMDYLKKHGDDDPVKTERALTKKN